MTPDHTPQVQIARRRKPRYFYGWNIVAASFLAQLAYAEQFSALLGLFIRPLSAEFGWTRAAIAGVQSLTRLLEAVTAPLIGPYVDRYGPRVLMVIGAVIVGFTMLAVTQVTALWQFYLFRGFFTAVGFTFMGALVINVAISNWFVRRRGRAIAVAGMGSQISNVIMAPVTVFVIAASGWRTSFVIFAVLTWLVVLLPSAILMRRRPEDMGLHPDGIDPNAVDDDAEPTEEASETSEETTPSTPEPVWTRREAMATVAFWVVSLCFAVGSLAFQGINISLAPYVQDLQYGDAIVAAVITFRAIIMAASLPVMGFVAEYADRPWVRAAPFLVQALGTSLFLLAAEPIFLWLAVGVYGLGFTGVIVTQEVVWANYFGRLSLGAVRSLGFLITFGFGAAGPIAMNLTFDLLGSYRPAFIVIIALFAIAALMLWASRPPRALRYATAEEIAPSSAPRAH